MKLDIDLSTMDLRTARVLMATLNAWFEARFGHDAQPEVAQNAGSSELARTPQSSDPAGQKPTVVEDVDSGKESSTTVETVKKPRKAKKEEPPAVTEPVPAVHTALPVTIDALRAALQRLTATQGMPAGIELLKKFGCARISELAEKDEATKLSFLVDCPPEAEAA